MLPFVIILALVTLGTIASFVSMLGAGGGIYVLLLLVSLVNEPPGNLVGSVYVMFLASAVTGSIVFSSARMIDYKSGLIIAVSCIPGILLGTYLGLSFSTSEFKVLLGTVTIGLSSILFLERTSFFSRLRRREAPESSTQQQSDQLKKGRAKTITDRAGRVYVYYPKPIAGIVAGGIAGILAGSVGGGPAVLLAPTMMVFVGMPPQIALATLRIVLLVLNTTVVTAHLAVNAIDLQYGIWLGVGAVLGTIVGARVIYRAKPMAIRNVVAFSLLLFGTYLIVSQLL